ncbi:MAG TPA: DUF871 domain-containing protein [Acholeplasmataceae bacterium]|nr:DUF871 domain-containing protein [Acholeplasmataceae bacterium]
MLGISVYFQDLDYEYLKEARKLGAKYLFTSLHLPEEDLSNLAKELPKFLKFINELDFHLIPDISPSTFSKLNLADNDYEGLKKLGFKVLRLDYGFDDFNLIKQIQQNFDIVLNASTINEKYLHYAKKNGIDLSKISLMHNFYPKTDTGLPKDHFKTLNEAFIKNDLNIMAFVTGDNLKRFPLYEGLPSLEDHRNTNPYIATLDLINNFGVSTILIGDSKAKIKTLKYISEYLETRVITIPTLLEKEYEYLYDNTYSVRRDPSYKIIRLGIPRKEGIEVINNNDRIKGAITMDNKLAGRYSGEVNIHKFNNGISSRSNIIGYIHPEYIDLVDYIKNHKIKFVKP